MTMPDLTSMYYARRPRNRNSQPRSAAKPYTQVAPPLSFPETTSSLSASDRWPCGVAGCTKSYGRTYDLVRHLDSAHHMALRGADDAALLAAGTPTKLISRIRELLGRRPQCNLCGQEFSRRDALIRHMDEQGHRLIDHPPSLTNVLSMSVPAWPDHSVLSASVPVGTFNLAAPSEPLLGDLHSFPPCDEDVLPLFPPDELFAHALSLCAGATPPSEAEIDRALSELGLCP